MAYVQAPDGSRRAPSAADQGAMQADVPRPASMLEGAPGRRCTAARACVGALVSMLAGRWRVAFEMEGAPPPPRPRLSGACCLGCGETCGVRAARCSACSRRRPDIPIEDTRNCRLFVGRHIPEPPESAGSLAAGDVDFPLICPVRIETPRFWKRGEREACGRCCCAESWPVPRERRRQSRERARRARDQRLRSPLRAAHFTKDGVLFVIGGATPPRAPPKA